MTTTLEERKRQVIGYIAEQLAHTCADFPHVKLSARFAQRGACYCGELMVVGRAVNGWGPNGWMPSELAGYESSRDFIQSSLGRGDVRPTADERCELRWIVDRWGATTGYNSARSAFWRCAKALSLAIRSETINPEAWASSLVWSNLYKVAPHAGGNPSARLAGLQRGVCRDLLLEEIRAFRPKRLVLATGFYWAEPFLDLPCFQMDRKPCGPMAHRKGSLVIEDEEIGRFVVADHPQGKNEKRWFSEVHTALS